ncbi:MAG: hypothetical protein IJ391_05175 [Clostridia bacterium]|nr:hypothetical protein [Clostridia bacterium]
MNESCNDIYKYVSRKTFFASLLMVCAFCLLCMLTALSGGKEHSAANDSEYVYASAPMSIYILRNIDGRVAVCDFADGTPIEMLDVYVSTLPESEQAALDNGICVTSISELIATVEAYTS